jgi:hypothetical protein
MHKIDALHATPDNEFTDGNPLAGIEATELISKWHNTIQREIVNVVEGAGLTLDDENDGQLLAAIQALLSESGARFTPLAVSVGTGGDYATINEAIEYISRFRPAYDIPGIRATITLLAGFVMAEQIICDGIDLSWVTITSADSVVQVTETAITQAVGAVDYGFSVTPVIAAIKGGKSPYIDVVFRYATRLTEGRTGLFAAGAGSVINGLNTGCQNAREYGCFAFGGGQIIAYSLSNYDAALYGTYAKGAGATITSGNIDNHDCAHAGCVAVDNGLISSVGTGNAINNAGCTYHGCVANTGGVISSENYIYNTGCGTRGAQSSVGGRIIAKVSMDNTGGGSNGVYAELGGMVIAVAMNNRRGASDDITDALVLLGGMIMRSSGNGGLCQAAGVMTADGYINT